jgi:S-adenosylmethionine-dependent methyltransferase
MSINSIAFDTHIDVWRHEESTPWQRIKRKVALSNLLQHLDKPALHILDAGGGNGYDSLPLAQLGHQIDIVDYSREMIMDGTSVFAESGLLKRVAFHERRIEDIPLLFPGNRFDALICHNVLPYVQDVPAALRAILAPLKPGGIVSVIALNRYSIPYHNAFLVGDLEFALQSIGARELNTIFDTVSKAYSATEMEEMLRVAGCAIKGSYGLRCIIGYWGDNERKTQPDNQARLEKLEFALTDEYPYKLLARFFQIIGQKQ